MKNKKITAVLIITLFLLINITPSTIGQNNYQISQYSEELKEHLFDKSVILLMKLAHKPSVATCIIINDNVTWSKGYGFYDIENKKPAKTDTLYLMASISKTVTATALMQLYDQKYFDLDDDVNKYLPFSLRNPNHPNENITIRMLLSHRSSLAGDNLYWLCLSYIPGDPDVPSYPYPWLKEYLTPNGSAYTSRIWSKYSPGEKYLYSNIGYSIIGYLVERISGKRFDLYCKDHIFTPLEMYNTSFRLKGLNLSNIAIPYEYNDGEYLAHPHYGMHIIYPSATMRTSIEEYSHFLIAHMNGGWYKDTRILNTTTVELMHTAHYPSSGKNNYGLGWSIRETFFDNKEIGHTGGWPGVQTFTRIKSDKNIAITIFTNCMDSELRTSPLETLAFKLLINALFLKSIRFSS